ncbi:unnamed protein product [Parajaminaea phylloscopi]
MAGGIAQTPIDPDTRPLLAALYDAAEQTDENPKPLVRHTQHRVANTTEGTSASPESASSWQITSWKTVEFAYRKAASVGIGKDLPTLARGLFTVADDSQPESSADAQRRNVQQRILARGYDKFFNVGEMAWTKPASIARYSSPPYLLTFKENGCIIFIAALSPSQLVVTSKHALESIKSPSGPRKERTDGAAVDVDDTEVDDVATSGAATSTQQRNASHAAMGEQWLSIHLNRVGRTKHELAAELWRRGETAVAELCDDSFEEHVLAYPPEKSGLHLHGLNANTVNFQTRPMSEVAAFATEWGFIPTRYMTLDSMQQVNEFTDRIGTTGEYEGEAIEGFVVRTAMPQTLPPAEKGAVAPPYSPSQTWFYKVKFDEPYLMYRDWRELAKRMLADKKKWDAALDPVAASTTTTVGAASVEACDPVVPEPDADTAKKSKNQMKKDRKALEKKQGSAKKSHTDAAPLPPPPKARSNRPETKLFVRWCYDRMYGSEDGRIRPQMALFDGITVGKGIIRLRDNFLSYLDSPQGRQALHELGGAKGAMAAKLGQTASNRGDTNVESAQREARPYTHLLVVPIAVPGCGKTSLFVALSHLLGSSGFLSHTQSDDVRAKKSGPTFLKNICQELSQSRVVLADRNNHLLKHRDEIVEAVRAWEDRGGMTEEDHRAMQKRARQKKSASGPATAAPDGSEAREDSSSKPRVKIVALAWSLDLLPLNTLHRMMSDRIIARGSNHQSLVADLTSAAGSRAHETILWRFLETLETLGSAEGKGEGDQGRGDSQFDAVVDLDVESSQKEQLRKVYSELVKLAPFDLPSPPPNDEQFSSALAIAASYKVTFQKEEAALANLPGDTTPKKTSGGKPRYYGIAVEVDLSKLVRGMLADAESRLPPTPANALNSSIKQAQAMIERLKADGRVTSRPHITLVHSSSILQQPQQQPGTAGTEAGQEPERVAAQKRWDTYRELASSPQAVEFDIELGHLAWDDKVMALSVQNVSPTAESSALLSSETFWSLQGGRGGPSEGAWRPHITVGTSSADIRPFEANRVMREAEAGPGGSTHPSGTEEAATAGEGSQRSPTLGLLELERSDQSRWRVRGRLLGMVA